MMGSWFVNFRVNAIIVILASFQQNLLNIWYFSTCFRLVCRIQKVRIVRVAFENTGLVGENHFNCDVNSWKKRVFDFIAKNGGKWLVQRKFALFDKLHDSHWREALGDRGDSEHRIVIDRFASLVLFSQIQIVEDLAVFGHLDLNPFKLPLAFQLLDGRSEIFCGGGVDGDQQCKQKN